MTKLRQKWLVAIATVGTFQFSLSSIFWLLYFAIPFFKGTHIDGGQALQEALIALPCIILMGIFWAALVLVLRGRDSATFTVFLGIGLAVLVFWYDVSHERYQARMHTDDGPKATYITWWWFPASPK